MRKTDLKAIDLQKVEYLTERLIEGPSLFPRDDMALYGEIWVSFQEMKLEIELLRKRSAILTKLINSVNYWLKATSSDALRTAIASMKAIGQEWNECLRNERQVAKNYSENEKYVELDNVANK